MFRVPTMSAMTGASVLASLPATALLCVAPALTACGDAPSPVPAADAPALPAVRSALAAGEEIVLADGGSGETRAAPTTPAGERLEASIRALDAAAASAAGLADTTVDYPLEGSLFPPGFVPPTFLWHDATPGVDAWLVRVEFAQGAPLLALVPGPPPDEGWIDRRAMGETNELYVPTEYQASARSWKPSPAVWAAIQARSVDTPATVAFLGFGADDVQRVLSLGDVRITTSSDPVDGLVFYRDVPLMPSVSDKTGKIQPLPQDAMPLIEWRLRDVTKPQSKLLLTGMRKCANCHSFSRDGKTMGMDVDGPQGDKGAYAMVPLAPQTVIDDGHVITWNSFPERPPDSKTIGFLSRISPDGRYAITTLNEALYVANFVDYRFLQVFFPTKGILGWTDIETGEIKALPGADDPDYVHCNAVWLPDGKSIVFTRAKAVHAPVDFHTMARYPNDEREPKVLYDVYRMPFDEGRGGVPVPVEGASDNGMSNTFPKVSPDGKWIVFTQCKNGLLMRPDGRLRIVPLEGGESRDMRCNTPLMNSWHSFSPNGRWLVFTSKSRRPYTQLFITHIDEDGNDTPAILVPDCTAANRAVNLPEFLNAKPEALDDISVPVVGHEAFLAYFDQGAYLMNKEHFAHAVRLLEKAVGLKPDFVTARLNLAFSLARSGQRDRAIESYIRALDVEPINAYANGALGALLAPSALETASLDELRAAAAADPRSLDAARRLAFALAQAEAGDDAFPLLEGILRSAPGDVEAHLAAAHLALRYDDVRAAVPHLEQVAALTPDDVRVRITLTWLRAASDGLVRDPRRAVEHAEAACKLTNSGDARAFDALAAALASAGKMEEAIDNASFALRLAKDDPSLARGIAKRLEIYRAGGHLGK